jgi:hypothetical protein
MLIWRSRLRLAAKKPIRMFSNLRRHDLGMAMAAERPRNNPYNRHILRSPVRITAQGDYPSQSSRFEEIPSPVFPKAGNARVILPPLPTIRDYLPSTHRTNT